MIKAMQGLKMMNVRLVCLIYLDIVPATGPTMMVQNWKIADVYHLPEREGKNKHPQETQETLDSFDMSGARAHKRVASFIAESPLYQDINF